METRPLSSLRQIEAAARSLFDPEVAIAATDPAQDHPLWQAEASAVARAVPKRRREFAAGRAAARTAMADLGIAPCPIPAFSDRAPHWPWGLAGSITHTDSLCLAVLSDRHLSLGIDLEEAEPLPDDLVPEICSPQELALLPRPYGHLTRLIFSAKESAYKAQYPLTGQVLSFADFEVRLMPQKTRFTATFQRAVPPFVAGAVLEGGFARAAGHLVTGVALAPR
ncbi:MAG: 4'-phosphopantetheinyl transferase superfamily protein [Sulfitobacter sp.]|nr:4'-phosphopantetheinyl transferase superfamily protein [Sulfitobacter sp.]